MLPVYEGKNMTTPITVFYSKKTTLKNPISPYDDKTFVFETFTANSNIEAYSILVSNFILNVPLDIPKPIRTFRRITHLEKHTVKEITYLVIDADYVKSEHAKQQILEYFKDHKVILGESKSYNGIDNFNVKGILFTEPMSYAEAKQTVAAMHIDLIDYCDLDESIVRRVSLNAPLMRNKVLYNNENGKLYEKVHRDQIAEIKKEYVEKSDQPTVNVEAISASDIEADSIDVLCLKIFKNMGFTAIKNNANGSISFKHPDEKKSPGGYFWFNSSPYTMHHANTSKTINIFEQVRKLPQAKELLKRDVNYDDALLEFNTDTNVVAVNQRYLEVTDEVNQTITSFIENKGGLLSIRSPMGTGKSTLIGRTIDEAHENDMKVLIITNRISVANDFGKKYGIKVYNQDKYSIGDSLICQYDSLWRYNVKFFDVIIMDEFISLMMHSRSNLNNSSINIAKFFGCFNKKLVIADAFLTGYENFLLSNKTYNVHLIDNIYRDPTTLYSYEDMNYFVQSLITHTDKHKVTISATSTSFIQSVSLMMKNRGKKVVTLTAETPESTKELIYDLFDKEDHDKWDVLIYSPTLTVGVSNLNDVGYHFHYDSSMSTDVISSIQMIKRTRKAKEIHMFLKERINYVKTTYNDIRDDYMGNIGKNVEQNYMFEIDDYGEPRLSDIGKKAIKIDTFKNILSFNHKGAFHWLMRYHFVNEPRIIDSKFEGSVLTKYQKQIKNDKDLALKNSIEQFISLNDYEITEIVEDSNADKVMKALADIDNHIQCDNDAIKQKLFELAIKDPKFITKCIYYKAAFNYTKKIWDDSDIKSRVSKAVTGGEGNDLTFYNQLLSVVDFEIVDHYSLSSINKNKKMKAILDKCGYKADTVNSYKSIGVREYSVDKNVKELYGFVK